MSTALLVIDTQTDYLERQPRSYEVERLIAVIQDLQERAREAGVPVVFVRHTHGPNGFMHPGFAGWEVHPAIAPLPGEVTVDKFASDAFYETDLAQQLQSMGVDHLVVTGQQTEMCVDATCRSALSHDFEVTLVTDGHTTWDSNQLTARQIIDHHNQLLPDLAHPKRHIVPMTSAEVVF